MKGCLVFLCVTVSLFSLYESLSVHEYEASLLRDWAINYTKNSGWNVTQDPCFWAGITCGSNSSGVYKEVMANPSILQDGILGNVVGIDLDPLVLGRIMYGEFPDLALWAEAKGNGTAFVDLRWITIQWFRFGPSFPSTINDYWTNYNDSNPKPPFNVLITTRPPLAAGNAAPSAICPLPDEFMGNMTLEHKSSPGREDVGCSNFYITSITPNLGPSAGGTTVTITVNAPLGFLNISVYFGEDGETNPVPITSLFLYDYPWVDYEYSWFGTVYSQLTLITCVSPPHTAGQVIVSIWAGSGSSVTPNQKVLPKVYWGAPYDQVFNYECPAGTSQSTVAGELVCTPCPPGTWSPVFSSACIPCLAGTYSDKPLSSSCTPCPLGTKSTLERATSIDNCTLCSQGTYSNELGAQTCTSCDPGYAQPLEGQTSCKPCQAGNYALGPGNKNCIKCNIGSFSKEPLSQGCTLCAVGEYQPIPGSTECLTCPPGKTTSQLGLENCDVTCGPGYYKSFNMDRCVPCAPGRFSNGSSSTLCTACVPGEYNPYTNATSCLPCPDGYTTSTIAQPSCTKIKTSAPQAQSENIGLIVGIVLLVVAIVLIIAAIIFVIIKKREQNQKQHEIDEIRKIMQGINDGGN